MSEVGGMLVGLLASPKLGAVALFFGQGFFCAVSETGIKAIYA